MDRLRIWAFGLAAISLLTSVAAAALGFLPVMPAQETFLFDLMVLAGAAPCLLLCTLLAIRRERLAGTLLWLASAVAALGLGLRSGPYLGRYLLGMVILVVPQVTVATLFLIHAKREEKRRPKEAKVRRTPWRT